MKKILYVLIASIILTSVMSCKKKDKKKSEDQNDPLAAYTLIAHYPFTSDGHEETGTYGDATMFNPVFRDNALYSNGIYYGDDLNNGCEVYTDNISGMNGKHFLVELEFKAEDFERPIIVLGNSVRVFMLYLEQSGKIRVDVLTNDHVKYFRSQETFQLNQWYKIEFGYDPADKKVYLWKNGDPDNEMTLPANVTPEFNYYEYELVNDHGGYGWAFKGYWKNLKVYIKN